jgi:hypothetical protein
MIPEAIFRLRPACADRLVVEITAGLHAITSPMLAACSGVKALSRLAPDKSQGLRGRKGGPLRALYKHAFNASCGTFVPAKAGTLLPL